MGAASGAADRNSWSPSAWIPSIHARAVPGRSLGVAAELRVLAGRQALRGACARATVDGSTGKRVDLDSAEWSTDDPKLVWHHARRQREVEIAVDRPGTAQLRVKAGGEEKIVQVASKQFPDAMDVAFRQ
jgi:hypothetical protein